MYVKENFIFLITKLFYVKLYKKRAKKQETIFTKFDAVLWGRLLESATIKDKNTIIFKFKDGT